MKKRYILFNRIKADHYAADAFVVRCFDDRFKKTFEKLAGHLGLKFFDAESVAGGAKIFSSPEKEGDRDFMARELEKSIQLHHTRRVIILTHSDCGAYDGLSKFRGDEEQEFKFHCAEHRKAKKFILNRFPHLKVETYFIDRSGAAKTS